MARYQKRPLGAKPVEEGEAGEILCPHCDKDLTDLYENGNLESVGHFEITIIKDSSSAEASCSMTIYFKCPYCNNAIEDYADWDI